MAGCFAPAVCCCDLHIHILLLILHKILSVRTEDVEQNTGLQAYAAVDNVVGLEHCIAFSDDILYSVNLKLESSARHVCNLCVGMMMQSADGWMRVISTRPPKKRKRK